MKIAVLVAFGLMLAGVFAAVFFNRESSPVMNAAIPVAVGAVTALFLVFAFAETGAISRTMPAMFFIQRIDNQQVLVPGRPVGSALHLGALARARDGRVFEQSPEELHARLAYHELLQRAIVDAIASRHFGTWRMEVDRFEFGGGSQEQFQPKADASQFDSVLLSAEDVERLFAGNRFASVHTGFGKARAASRHSVGR